MDTDGLHNCFVVGCINKQENSKLCFFTFPTELERQAMWLRMIGRPELVNMIDFSQQDVRVCSKHFSTTAKSEVVVRKLLGDAVPTKFLPTSPPVDVTHLEVDDGIADAATQTDMTYGGVYEPEKDVYVEVNGKKIMIKKEKDPERRKINTFVLAKPPANREPESSYVNPYDMGPSTSKMTRN